MRDGAPLEPWRTVPRQGSGKPDAHIAFFAALITQDKDITLGELRDALYDAHGVTCAISGIDAALRRHGYTFKKTITGFGRIAASSYRRA